MKDVVIVILIILAVGIPLHSIAGTDAPYETAFYKQRMADLKNITARFDIRDQPTVLYLDAGDAVYYFKANSSCRYPNPLPVTRHRDDWNLSHLAQYNENRHCIVTYDGKYIIMEGNLFYGWFGENQTVRSDIISMIRSNYTEMYNRSWTIMKKNE